MRTEPLKRFPLSSLPIAVALVALMALPLAGCGGDQPAPPTSDQPVEPIASGTGTAGTGTAGTDAGAAAPTATTIQWDLPDGWRSEAPTSAMRLAQAAIPGEGGEGQLLVFHFGPGGGGGTEANIQRWIEQVQQEPGSEPRREEFEVDGYQVILVDVKGTLQPSTMVSGPSSPQPDQRLLGAVVEGPGGPWFFKATGPQATLDGEAEAFRAMLESIRPAE